MLYLIHFDRPYRHARHYLGFCRDGRDFLKRIEEHRKNRGARLLQVINAAGIPWEVARVWSKGSRTDERRMKQRGHLPDYCPHCRETRNAKRRKSHHLSVH